MTWRDDTSHALQLAAAVLLAFAASAALGLPEGLWAVMSALVVVRPNTGATLGAGWQRARGALCGTLAGLAGVWLRQRGLGSPLATVGIVAALAAASAPWAGMRSAPISALIVLSSGGVAGHGALQVATLRIAEIAVGVASGIAVALLHRGSRASARFDAEVAALLRRLADDVRDGAARSAEEKEARAVELRARLRALAVLADGADREGRWPPWRARGDAHARLARLMARTSHDAGALQRLRETMPAGRAEAAWAEMRIAWCAALDAAAAARLGDTAADFGALRRCCAVAAAGGMPEAGSAAESAAMPPLVAGPSRLLLQDLGALARR